ncbi:MULTISPECIES: MetQ/NlpA family ABC transporter substrate-binding protein [unclassified Methylobacterium]|uniref:MetQ/NlpA family ABC transporter substrate-binding protein n=1 Tax=unclassified Methylobacterium TaxID=2615210 RepID=UPI00226AF863|nr:MULTISPECIES: MetQ/NlpA family ABC transporter substrate-binding protein [unclassified Methylobacterium]
MKFDICYSCTKCCVSGYEEERLSSRRLQKMHTVPASTRRVFLSGAVALSLGPARAAVPPLRVVASSVPHVEILDFVADKLAADLPLKIIEISGDLRPNALLRDGDADANFFQHVPFLRTEEAAMGVHFAVVAAVHIEPLGLYSRRVKALNALPTGGLVSLSNTVSNTNRGLLLLQANGLIRLRTKDAGALATLDDVIENPKKLRFVEIAPPQVPRSLDDVALAVINGNYALEAGLEPARDALALERAEGNPYANVLVTTEGLAKDPRVLRLGTLLTSAEVAAFIRTRYRGSVLPVRPS